jgi:hypothetical protein
MGFSSSESARGVLSTYLFAFINWSFQINSRYGWLTEYVDSIMTLFQGQAMDLFWTYNGRVPSEEEYYRMIDQSKYGLRGLRLGLFSLTPTSETGQLFSIATSLLLDGSDNVVPKEEIRTCLDQLTSLLGRCFQIRDDYQNLVSADVRVHHFLLKWYRKAFQLTEFFLGSIESRKASARISTKGNGPWL